MANAALSAADFTSLLLWFACSKPNSDGQEITGGRTQTEKEERKKKGKEKKKKKIVSQYMLTGSFSGFPRARYSGFRLFEKSQSSPHFFPKLHKQKRN